MPSALLVLAIAIAITVWQALWCHPRSVFDEASPSPRFRRRPWTGAASLATGHAFFPTVFSTGSNSAIASLPCLRKWNADALRRSHDDIELVAWTQPSREFVLARGREADYNLSRSVGTKALSLSAFWREASNRSLLHYHSGPLADWGPVLAADAAGLLDALSIVDAPSDMPRRSWPLPSGQMVWMGAEVVVATPHYDTSLNVVLQVFGVKRWMLWPPDDLIGHLPMHPSTHPSRRQARGRLTDNAAGDGYAQAASRRAMRVDVHPGEALFVPPYWTHAVESHTPALSLSVLSPSWTEAVGARIAWHKGGGSRAATAAAATWLDRLPPDNAARRVLALRLYLRALIPRVFGAGETAPHFVRALYQLRHDPGVGGGARGEGAHGGGAADGEGASGAGSAPWSSALGDACCDDADGTRDCGDVGGGSGDGHGDLPSAAEVHDAVERVRGVLEWDDDGKRLSTAVAIELVRGHVEELAVWAVGDEAHAALLSALGGTTC